jgi:hypothetical protein
MGKAYDISGTENITKLVWEIIGFPCLTQANRIAYFTIANRLGGTSLYLAALSA